MKSLSTIMLVLILAASVHAAAPVHIALKSSATVQPDGDGFFALGAVADLSGGNKITRARMSTVIVGRAPLPGETRSLTEGDISLKLRQAGFHPDVDAVLEGAGRSIVSVMASAAPVVPPLPNTGSGLRISASATPAATPLIHRGAAVTILIQDGAITITAPGVAREEGRVGDTIRVHRDGVMTDLSVTVLDTQTVQMRT